MKLFFVTINLSGLSDREAKILISIRKSLLSRNDVEEVHSPYQADAIVIQEENSFKNFRYIKALISDSIVSTFPEKVFTINTDDCATGLLRGLYTSLPMTRFNPNIHVSVPYMEFPNHLVFEDNLEEVKPILLASWRGNTKSNALRSKMVNLFKKESRLCLQTSNRWLNHDLEEKRFYADLIRSSKFSLCPAGWAPVSFRIYESMALGRCPVIIADKFVPPKGPDWEQFALFFPEKELKDLPAFLYKHEHLAEQLGHKALEAWQKYFHINVIKEYYADALIALIRSAPKTTKMEELNRWKSFSLYWNNKWTLPQRMLNKISRWGHIADERLRSRLLSN